MVITVQQKVTVLLEERLKIIFMKLINNSRSEHI